MSFRNWPGGFITASYDPLKVPNAPTNVAGSSGDQSASVSFTAPTNVGGSAISSYVAISDPGEFEGTAASSPVTVSGLTNGTPYTFRVWAINSYGPSAYSASTGSITPALQRALFGGGDTGSDSAVIDYFNIATTGNATNFGSLTQARRYLTGFSSSTRGLFAGGSPSPNNTIDYVTIATTGNATDFGDLTINILEGPGACSSSTRGLVGGGFAQGVPNSRTAVIGYVTMATTGNATSFGNLTVARVGLAGCSSSTTGIFAGGFDTGSTYYNVVDYVTIATTGNAFDFGDLTVGRTYLAGCSSSTRGVFAGGYTGSGVNNIDYITIASAGNATDFGDLTGGFWKLAGSSSNTRGLFGGGQAGSFRYATTTYVTIATTGNATTFGDLTVARDLLASCSSAHGGLQ